MLEKSLKDVGLIVKVSDKNDLTVRGHRGETTLAQFAIQQANGYDFGFVFNGTQYELVADTQYWQQNTPVTAFLEKLTKQYSVNTVLNVAQKEGFTVNEQFVN